MITIDENNSANENLESNGVSELEDVQGKVESLRTSLSNGEIPEDLREFIVSLKNDSNIEDLSNEGNELDGGDEVTSYEVEIDESLADGDDVDLIDGNVNVSDNDLFLFTFDTSSSNIILFMSTTPIIRIYNLNI